MKPRIRYSHWFVPLGYKAWVIAPYIFFKTNKETTTDRLFRHELEHIYQVDREGWFKFYIKYIWYSIRYGYLKNPYEVEARTAQERPLSPVERHWKDHA
jgi:hypothetical protein